MLELTPGQWVSCRKYNTCFPNILLQSQLGQDWTLSPAWGMQVSFFSVPAPRRGRRWHAWLYSPVYNTWHLPLLECEAGILRAVASLAHHHCRHCMSEVSCDSVGEFLQPLLRVEIVHCVSVQQAVWAIQGNSIVQCPKDFSTLFCLFQTPLSCSSCILGIWVQFYFHFHRAFPDGGTLTPQKHWIYFYYSFHRATDLSGIPLLRRE